MNIAAEKEILIHWIKTIDDIETISKLKEIKIEEDFDFEKEWKRSISGDELKKRTKNFIKTLPWEK